MKRINLKQYFSTFDARMKSFLVIAMFLFFTTYFVFGEMDKLNYLMYPPAGAIVILCFIYYFKKKQIPNFRPLICIYVFVGLAYLVTFINNPLTAITYKTLIVLALFSTSIYLGCSIIDNKKVIMLSLTIAGLIFCLAFAIVYFKDVVHLNFSTRLGSYFGNENDVALKLGFTAAVIAISIIYSKKYWFLPLAIPPIIFTLLTGSRSGLFVVFIVAVISIFLIFRHNVKIALAISVLSAVVFLLLILFVPAFNTIKTRLLAFFEYKNGDIIETSSFLRDLYKKSALYLSFKNLLLGYGADGFDVVSEFGTYSHNNLAEVLCDFGIFGFIAFYGTIIYILKNIKLKKCVNDGTIIYYVMLLIYIPLSFGVVYYYNKTLFILFAITLYINEHNKIDKQLNNISI